MNELNQIKDIFYEIKNVSSKKGKEFILRQHEDNELFKECLKFLLDPEIVTGLSTKKMNKDVGYDEVTTGDITIMFDYLKRNNTGRDEDIRTIKTFCLIQEDTEFWTEFFSGKFKCGLDVKGVNKVYGNNFIEDFSIQLGSKFDFEKPPKGMMFATEKFDGIRCFCSIKDGKVTLKSRQGKIFEGLKDIEESLLKLHIDNVCLDGELLAIDVPKEDVYKETTKRVNNKNEVKDGVVFMVFDIVLLEEFENKKGEHNYSVRRKVLDKIEENDLEENSLVKITPLLYKGNDINEILPILDKYRNEGAEGLMVNLDKPYEFKRTKNLLKMKVMQTCDIRCIGIEEGQGKYKGTLGAIICDYKGFELRVGSGFSDEQRKFFYENPNDIVGRIIECQFFEETHDKDGNLSLRFPIFKTIRNDKNDVPYE